MLRRLGASIKNILANIINYRMSFRLTTIRLHTMYTL